MLVFSLVTACCASFRQRVTRGTSRPLWWSCRRCGLILLPRHTLPSPKRLTIPGEVMLLSLSPSCCLFTLSLHDTSFVKISNDSQREVQKNYKKKGESLIRTLKSAYFLSSFQTGLEPAEHCITLHQCVDEPK